VIGNLDEELGDVDSARPELALSQTGAELAKAARIDSHDVVKVRCGDLIELGVEQALAVSGAQERVGPRGAAA
jgi:hypothetical protein